MLKIMGVGMPRTGTASLAAALRILGFNTLHHAPERLDLDTLALVGGSFRGYDDVDAVVDMPAAYFYPEIGMAYGVQKYILTTRDTDDWWESIKAHANRIRVSADQKHIRYSDRLHALLFGTHAPHEFLWKRRYRDWGTDTFLELSGRFGRGAVLDMDITTGDNWIRLCPFLGVPEPDVEFPWENRRG